MVGSALGRTCIVWIQSRETGSAEMHPGPHGERVRNTEALGGEGSAWRKQGQGSSSCLVLNGFPGAEGSLLGMCSVCNHTSQTADKTVVDG